MAQLYPLCLVTVNLVLWPECMQLPGLICKHTSKDMKRDERHINTFLIFSLFEMLFFFYPGSFSAYKT